MTVWTFVILAVALAGWAYVFVPARDGIWVRTWTTAGVLTALSLVALISQGELGDAVGGVDAASISAGVGVGVAWVVLTQAGHWMLCQIVPSFIDQVRDLYSIAVGDRRRDVLIALVSMALAEELVFRLVTQRTLGLVAGVVAYTIVQAVVRNWALMLAGAACGVVWGALYAWQGDLAAPLIAHVMWTGTLTFLWPLSGCGGAPVPEAESVAVTASSPR